MTSRSELYRPTGAFQNTIMQLRRGDSNASTQDSQMTTAEKADDSSRGAVALDEMKLVNWNRAAAILHMALAIVTALQQDVKLKLYPLYVTARVDAQQGVYELVPFAPIPHSHVLNLRLAVFSFFIITAFFHFGYAQLWREWYLENISNARNSLRFIEYGLSAPIMCACIAYFTGTLWAYCIFCLMALTSTTMAFGHLTELLSRPKNANEWVESFDVRLQPHVLGYIPQLACWICIYGQFALSASAESPGGGKMPDFVYFIVISQLISFWSFGGVQLYTLMSPPKKYINGELAYVVLSATSKALLGGALLTQLFFNAS